MPATSCGQDVCRVSLLGCGQAELYVVSTCQDWLALMPTACQACKALQCAPRGPPLAPGSTSNVGHSPMRQETKKQRSL